MLSYLQQHRRDLLQSLVTKVQERYADPTELLSRFPPSQVSRILHASLTTISPKMKNYPPRQDPLHARTCPLEAPPAWMSPDPEFCLIIRRGDERTRVVLHGQTQNEWTEIWV